MHVQLSNKQDVFIWELTKLGNFTVYMPLDLMNDHTRYLPIYIRKIKVPFKIKVLLTKNNLAFFCEEVKLVAFVTKMSLYNTSFGCPFLKLFGA
jgi:hypothetical protein